MTSKAVRNCVLAWVKDLPFRRTGIPHITFSLFAILNAVEEIIEEDGDGNADHITHDCHDEMVGIKPSAGS